MPEKKSKAAVLTAGIIKENPVLVLVLGTCPVLAVSTSAINALGMGVAATFVLICSNVVIALLKNLIPNKVRIPCYIVVIAAFVTLVQMILHAFVPTLYDALGIFLPLIVVNCIILGRAEAFASKNTVIDSFLDGLGMGVGFTLAIGFIGIIREVVGFGSFFGISLGENFQTISIIGLAPGGFFVYGCIIAILNKLTKGRGVKRKSFDCESCPSAASCAGGSCPAASEGGAAK